ncbi:MAG: hypothetical protein ACUZ8O_03800 [Candidatus Anammoxibacter sp.]
MAKKKKNDGTGKDSSEETVGGFEPTPDTSEDTNGSSNQGDKDVSGETVVQMTAAEEAAASFEPNPTPFGKIKESFKKGVEDVKNREKADNDVSEETIAGETVDGVAPASTPFAKIKKSFTKGVKEGRKTFLKKLMQVKGVDVKEIQKLYATGLIEPEILKDISLTDLVKSTGINMDFAKTVKDVLIRKDDDSSSYVKEEIDRLRHDTDEIFVETEKAKKEVEKLNMGYDTYQDELDGVMNEREQYYFELEKFKDDETNSYFKEKTLQDELVFVLEEHESFKNEVERFAENFGYSEKDLSGIKREFDFTKGECSYILEKIDYLMAKLDTSMKIKGDSQENLQSFLDQLQSVHSTLVAAYKKTSVEYYVNKQ